MNNNIDENEKTLMEALEKQIMEPADCLPEYVARARGSLAIGEPPASKEEIIEALKTVRDPEIMMNIYDLGLVYNIDLSENGDVAVEMTVTSPMCPVAGILPQQAAFAIATLPVADIEVKIVWEPAWTIDRLTEDAKAVLEIL